MKYTIKMALLDKKILRIMKEMHKRGIDFEEDLTEHRCLLANLMKDYNRILAKTDSFKISIYRKRLAKTISKFYEFAKSIGLEDTMTDVVVNGITVTYPNNWN